MRSRRKFAAAALALGAVVAIPGWAQQTAPERSDLARYEQYAGAPVDQVHYYQISGFQYLAPDTLAIRFAVNQTYLITVQTPCINLAYANAMGLFSRNHTLYRSFDYVTFDHQRCRILKIVPVNELKMKQDAARARASGG